MVRSPPAAGAASQRTTGVVGSGQNVQQMLMYARYAARIARLVSGRDTLTIARTASRAMNG